MLVFLRRSLTRKLRCSNLQYANLSTERHDSKGVPRKIQENKVKIGKWWVNYLQAGSGPHIVLCPPGAFGTFWTDYTYQLEGFDLEKFTLIGYDTPGFGKSKPPERDYMLDLHHSDAEMTRELMKTLGIQKYSLMGWSYGAITSLIHAGKYPENINKLVVWGAQARYLPREIQNFKDVEDLSRLPPKLIRTRIEMYGKDFQKYWSALVYAMSNKYKPEGDICTGLLKNISCPTFILYGAKDNLVDSSHITYLNSHIINSRTLVYPEGKHSIQWGFAEDFNKRVQEFLLEP